MADIELADMVEFLVSKVGSEQKIAEVVKTSQPTIHRIRHGGGTTWEIGKSLEGLYLSKQPVLERPAQSAMSDNIVSV